MIEVDAFTTTLSSDEPSGPNLEYDRDFIELDRISQGSPERQIGETVVAGEGPDWRAVAKLSTSVLERSRDLRAAVQLTRAQSHLERWGGLANGLALVRALVDTQWETVHPQLDPDDDNDPTMRVNVLASLADPDALVNALRVLPMVSVRGLGAYSLRDVQIAVGELRPAEGAPEPVERRTIESAFAAADLAELTSALEAMREAERDAAALESLVSERTGDFGLLRLTRLRDVLKQAAKAMDERVALRGSGDGAGADGTGTDGDAAGGDDAARGGRGAGGAGSWSGEITTRDEATRAIDKLLAYYQRNEPSSPVPLLLNRAKKMVSMSFLDIIRNMAPDGLTQVETIRGPEEES